MVIICSACGKKNTDSAKYCSSCASSLKQPLSPGAILDAGTMLENRYKILHLIKAGGMGAVYKAMNCKLESICAVKELVPYHMEEEEEEKSKEWFKREAKLLARLDHPNLPKVFDYFIINDRYYLVMNFVDGEDLYTKLAIEGNPGLPQDKVVEWAKAVLEVLDYLHSQDPVIIYRDIKPANIMINKYGRVMLVDFGLARTVHNFSMKKTARGTFGYAPLEQYEGEAETRSDIYALGATMHHLLTGIEPFSFRFEPLREILPDISPELEKIVMKSLEVEVESRFSSAVEMFDALTLHGGTPLKVDYKKKESNRVKTPEQIWTFSAAGPVSTTPCIDERMVYFGSDDNKLYCLDGRTGEKIWEFETEDRLRASPCIRGEFIYFGSDDDKLYCLNKRTGAISWSFETGFRISSSPVVYSGNIYFGSEDNSFYCLDAINGRRLWSFEAGDWICTKPCVSDEKVYFGSNDRVFYCIDAMSGEEKWKFTAGHRICADPLIFEDLLYFGSDDDNFYCLEAERGQKLWSFKTNSRVRTSPCIFEGLLYFGSDKLYCLEAKDGVKIWDFKEGGGYIANPCVVNSCISFGTSDGLCTLDSKSGNLVWNFKTGDRVVSTPSVSGEFIYFGSDRGIFYCLNKDKLKDDFKISDILARRLRTNLKKILFGPS